MSGAVRRTALILVSGGLLVAWGGEWMARRHMERRYRAAIEAQQQLELQLGELQAERGRLSEALTTEQQHSAQLNAAIMEKDAVVKETLARLNQEERTVKDLHEKLAGVQRQFDLMQGELAATLQQQSAVPGPSASGGMVQLERVIVAQDSHADAASDVQGRILSVHPEWRFVVISLGWDLVKIGDVVSIYRNDQLLGKARVERVQEQVSAATLLPEWSDAHVQANDVVRTL